MFPAFIGSLSFGSFTGRPALIDKASTKPDLTCFSLWRHRNTGIGKSLGNAAIMRVMTWKLPALPPMIIAFYIGVIYSARFLYNFSSWFKHVSFVKYEVFANDSLLPVLMNPPRRVDFISFSVTLSCSVGLKYINR